MMKKFRDSETRDQKFWLTVKSRLKGMEVQIILLFKLMITLVKWLVIWPIKNRRRKRKRKSLNIVIKQARQSLE